MWKQFSKPTLSIRNTSRINIASTLKTNEEVKQTDTAENVKNDNSKNYVAQDKIDTPANDNEAPYVKISNKKPKSPKENSKMDDKSKAINCYFYLQFKCKFGRWGEDCPFEHPKICFSYLREGIKGCNKAENCQFLHPEVCKSSIEGKKCDLKGCKNPHFKYLIDIAEKVVDKNTKNGPKSSKPNFRTLASKGTKMKKMEKVTPPSPSTSPPLLPTPSQHHSPPAPLITAPTVQAATPFLPAQAALATPPLQISQMDNLTRTLKNMEEQMTMLWAVMQQKTPAQMPAPLNQIQMSAPMQYAQVARSNITENTGPVYLMQTR